jgi:hypothetical protein
MLHKPITGTFDLFMNFCLRASLKLVLQRFLRIFWRDRSTDEKTLAAFKKEVAIMRFVAVNFSFPHWRRRIFARRRQFSPSSSLISLQYSHSCLFVAQNANLPLRPVARSGFRFYLLRSALIPFKSIWWDHAHKMLCLFAMQHYISPKHLSVRSTQRSSPISPSVTHHYSICRK